MRSRQGLVIVGLLLGASSCNALIGVDDPVLRETGGGGQDAGGGMEPLAGHAGMLATGGGGGGMRSGGAPTAGGGLRAGGGLAGAAGRAGSGGVTAGFAGLSGKQAGGSGGTVAGNAGLDGGGTGGLATSSGGITSGGGVGGLVITPSGGIGTGGGSVTPSGGTGTGGLGSGGVSPTGGIGTGGAATGGTTPLLPCATQRLTTSGTNLLTGANRDTTDQFALSCGSGTAPDYAFEWVAPNTGYYSLNTNGSNFDTVLGVLSPSCSGPELACNNDVTGDIYSEVVRKFAKGDRSLVVIDGNVGATGDFVFNAEPVTCPSTDLTGQTMPVTLSTAGATDQHSGACGGAGFPDRAYVWVPSTSGLYRFTVSSSTIQPALYVEQGAKCGSQLLGCNPASGTIPMTANVTRRLTAGQPVTVIVDSLTAATGAFQLNITQLSAACPDALLDDAVDVVLDDTVPELVASSCLASSGDGFYPNHAYAYSPMRCSTCSCTVTITSDNAINAFLLEGSQCDGVETASSCLASTCSGGTCTIGFRFNAASAPNYVIVVQGPFQGSIVRGTATYSIMAACIA